MAWMVGLCPGSRTITGLRPLGAAATGWVVRGAGAVVVVRDGASVEVRVLGAEVAGAVVDEDADDDAVVDAAAVDGAADGALADVLAEDAEGGAESPTGVDVELHPASTRPRALTVATVARTRDIRRFMPAR